MVQDHRWLPILYTADCASGAPLIQYQEEKVAGMFLDDFPVRGLLTWERLRCWVALNRAEKVVSSITRADSQVSWLPQFSLMIPVSPLTVDHPLCCLFFFFFPRLPWWALKCPPGSFVPCLARCKPQCFLLSWFVGIQPTGACICLSLEFCHRLFVLKGAVLAAGEHSSLDLQKLTISY